MIRLPLHCFSKFSKSGSSFKYQLIVVLFLPCWQIDSSAEVITKKTEELAKLAEQDDKAKVSYNYSETSYKGDIPLSIKKSQFHLSTDLSWYLEIFTILDADAAHNTHDVITSFQNDFEAQ